MPTSTNQRPFRKLLIANRGEIAVRIIRACRELRIPTVAVYSEADADALHVRMADEAMCIGPPPNKDSYLNIPNIVTAALVTECDAVHPGVGNLSEMASFAENCEICKLTFIGPAAATIEAMQDKAEAKRIMRRAGVPVIPGSGSAVWNEQDAVEAARPLGYPLMIKATAGGGGRGIRIVQNNEDLVRQIKIAQREAEAAFGRPELDRLERALTELDTPDSVSGGHLEHSLGTAARYAPGAPTKRANNDTRPCLYVDLIGFLDRLRASGLCCGATTAALRRDECYL